MRRIAAFLFAALLCLPAVVQDAYPSRPITLTSPYAPGGASDFLAHTLGAALKARLGQPVRVQNVPGVGETDRGYSQWIVITKVIEFAIFNS